MFKKQLYLSFTRLKLMNKTISYFINFLTNLFINKSKYIFFIVIKFIFIAALINLYKFITFIIVKN